MECREERERVSVQGWKLNFSASHLYLFHPPPICISLVLLPPFVHRRVHNRVGMHSSRYTASHEIRNGRKREKYEERGREREKKHRKGVAIERDTEKNLLVSTYESCCILSPSILIFFILLQGLKNSLNDQLEINCFDE